MSTTHNPKSWWRQRLEQVAGSRFGGWFMTTIAPPVDRVLLRVSKGRLGMSALLYRTLILHSTGAKSGQPRTTPLVFFEDGANLVIIASNGGRPNYPAWYFNLRAHPQVEAEIDGVRRSFSAREAEGNERDRLWQRAVRLYGGFDAYRRRADNRHVPVIVLEPES